MSAAHGSAVSDPRRVGRAVPRLVLVVVCLLFAYLGGYLVFRSEYAVRLEGRYRVTYLPDGETYPQKLWRFLFRPAMAIDFTLTDREFYYQIRDGLIANGVPSVRVD